jgi:hypothetical protein
MTNPEMSSKLKRVLVEDEGRLDGEWTLRALRDPRGEVTKVVEL